MKVTVENVVKVSNQMINYAQQLKMNVFNQIIEVGNKIVEELQLRFPDLSITGQFFTNSLEYWIVISRMGEEMTYIECPVSNLKFTRRRKEDGTQDFRSDIPELDLDEVVNNIARDLTLQLNLVGAK